MRRRVLSLVLIALVFAGCGSSSDDEVTESAESTTTQAETTTTSSTTTELETTTTTAPPRALEPLLITIDDLPGGWSADDQEARTVDDANAPKAEPPECAPDQRTWEVDPVEKAENAFVQGRGQRFLVSSAGNWEQGGAAAALADLRAGVEQCPTYTEIDPRGGRTTVTLSPVEVPELGDERFAWITTTQFPDGAAVRVVDAHVRLGDSLVSIADGGFQASEDELVAQVGAMLQVMVGRA